MKRLLIANRGEIAIRVMRTAREMGIRTVAVYSEADAHSMHANFADEAVLIGGSEPSASYLKIDAIIHAATTTQADAVHPGYGFLSERAEFVDACAANNISFIGPPASAMRALGDKISAKTLAQNSNVPLVPGFFDPKASDADLEQAAKSIGFPVMLKASAGGGGRGMRAVFDAKEFAPELATARDEALRAFGDGTMMVEKLINEPRHIEVQVLADQHGGAAVLFERECSIQRRHQKLIEEAPSPVMTDALWQRMRTAALELVKASGYQGAGTVEFIVDSAATDFYFLEVNARLQVEHPVTECITGLDLVRAQIEIARGARIESIVPAAILQGDRSAIRGHAIEARVNAENPAQNFLPSIGKIAGWAPPTGPGIRVDAGFCADSEVTRFYDSMVAKVISHAPTRSAAAARLIEALRDFHVIGVKTNIPYVLRVLAEPEFASAQFDTGFLGRREDLLEAEAPHVALLELMQLAHGCGVGSSHTVEKAPGAWDLGDSYRNARLKVDA